MQETFTAEPETGITERIFNEYWQVVNLALERELAYRRQQADDRADELIAEARLTATDMVNEASKEADRIVSEANRRAAGILADTRQSARVKIPVAA